MGVKLADLGARVPPDGKVKVKAAAGPALDGRRPSCVANKYHPAIMDPGIEEPNHSAVCQGFESNPARTLVREAKVWAGNIDE
jgi:hypothetical protein